MPERPSLAEALRPVADAKPTSAKPRGRRGKRGIVTYVETETARRIKMLAVQRDTTLQALGVEAWHLLLERYGTKGRNPSPPSVEEGWSGDHGSEAR